MQWGAFDNTQHKLDPIQTAGSTHLPPETSRAAVGSYFLADIHIMGEPFKPVSVYLRKEVNSYRVVGIDRL